MAVGMDVNGLIRRYPENKHGNEMTDNTGERGEPGGGRGFGLGL